MIGLALLAAMSQACGPVEYQDEAARAEVKAEIRRVVAELGGSPRFAAYLIVVASRESSLQPDVIHEGDAKHAAAAYRRLRASHIASGHPFARVPEVWQSYGLFGMNSNYHADRVADPRQLCTTRGAVTVYVQAARSVIRRMRRCDPALTFGDVHRAIQRGKICPDGRREKLSARIAAEPLLPGDLG